MIKGAKVQFDPAKHCGRQRAHGAGPCLLPLGQRTSHVGSGACYKHGGNTPIKHGLYASIQSTSLQAAMIAVEESGVDIMDLSPEAKLMRAMVRDFVGRHESLKDALLKFNESFSPAFQTIVTSNDPKEIAQAIAAVKDSITKRPRESQIFDIDAAGILADRFGRMIERIHKIRMTSSVTYESVIIYAERIGMVIKKHVKDHETLRALLKDIEDVDIPTTAKTWSSND